MKHILFLGAFLMLLVSVVQADTFFIPSELTEKTIQELVQQHGEEHQFRIDRGVQQVSILWTEKDGNHQEFAEFCKTRFLIQENEIDNLFERFSHYYEILWGNANKMIVGLQKVIHLDCGPIDDIDQMFGGYDPSAHIEEDLYKNKVAFLVALNFPHYSLAEKTKLGDGWNRKQWAYARMGDIFLSRVPAKLLQKFTQVKSESRAYMGNYNIHIGTLVKNPGNAYFKKDKRLIHHWGLRDEIKALYADRNAEKQQKTIHKVMNRIIAQEIPIAIVNNTDYQWNPHTNQVWKDGEEVELAREQDIRYQTLLNNFKVLQQIDPYYPSCSNYIARKAETDLEISMEDIEKVFEEFLSHPIAIKVADVMRKRLGRKLYAYDIWYTGFKPGSDLSEDMLDALVQSEYRDIPTLQKQIPTILEKLGFDKEKANRYAKDIVIEPARGAGHAWGPMMRGDKCYMRIRTPKNGIDYKGFNVFMHELGHNIEQLMTMNDIDYYMLNGVPNTAFTEAWAFLFQERDLKILGLDNLNANAKFWNALDSFWSTREIMGVGLVDIRSWRWMYEHPEASATELKEAVLQIAKDIWNEYYTPSFGSKDEILLATYTHMIYYPLYLPNYPLGHLIEFQLNKQLEGKKMGDELERIFLYGRIIPQQWMRHAVGSNLSGQPMLEATIEAYKKLFNE
ncbi:MAG TPA: hypothetical protein P5543_10645 [Planctomycetota bacterium]|nr:hypothetical protein [Planctomycetota bacterium]HRU52636.1 hypothetical protein [Planctomycetota bacterium]